MNKYKTTVIIYGKFVLESRPRLGESIVDYYPVLKIKCQTEGKIQHKLSISFSLGEFMLGSDILHQAVGATGGAKNLEILIGCYEAYSICQNSFWNTIQCDEPILIPIKGSL